MLTAAFVLPPQFSLFGCGVALDLIRMANDSLPQQGLRTRIVAGAAGPVEASCGAYLVADTAWSELRSADLLFVCSSRHGAAVSDPGLLACLRRSRRRGARIIALGSGIWAVARAGLLAGRRSAADPSEARRLQEAYPETEFTLEPFVVDGPVATCIGGDSVTDLMLRLLAEQFGPRVAEDVRRFVFLKPTRSLGLLRSLGLFDPTIALDRRLARMLVLFEQRLDVPQPLHRLCREVGLSPRSLGRLTADAFGCSPKALYLRMRLTHAEALLLDTALPISAVAAACGFRQPSHFSRAFAARYGDSPRNWRVVRRAERSQSTLDSSRLSCSA